jgi:hypothetical protein
MKVEQPAVVRVNLASIPKNKRVSKRGFITLFGWYLSSRK